ncbi:uncharacterized protein LOC123530345 [Mercenaria mercenaria]|uniref:uncharacterized protein LOC123530345 n=1 Tax=Mercenaria mercenaria TaxID=6596 RepID=UPI00234E945C|nr:uncharacterized protein LOC123530345 [Mercenaria mercenaria]
MLFLFFVLCFYGNSLIYAVHRPPSIYIQPTDKDIYYKSGEKVEISCAAHGIPKPWYIWKRNGNAYDPSSQDGRVVQLPDQGTLVFNTTLPEDEGVYQCFADNGYGVSASVKFKLRMGKLKTFANEPNRTHTVEAGKDFTLPCVPPQSVPPADVFWVVREAYGRFQPVYYNKRISMDLEGRLRFTNVEKSDEQDGRAYHCMAVNNLIRASSTGPGHIVKVLESKQQTHSPHYLWTSPSDNIFIKGETMRLKCIFAGDPTPNIYWKKIQGTFSYQARFKSYGQELYTGNVQESDAGQYMCMNQIEESTHVIARTFHVRIDSAPYWVQEPKTVEARVDDEATFVCEADGVPKPKYTRYINGVPLEGVRDPRVFNNSRIVMKDTNTLKLTKLTLEDHMNIQCNASNIHGYVFSDVYLNVYRNLSGEKPTIIKHPPAEIKVAESRPVTIDCLVKGEPYPNVTWYKSRQQIGLGWYKFMPNGSLYISEARFEDAGDYHCNAKNIYGKVTSSACKLLIRRKTKIEQFPLDMVIRAEENVRFTCSGSTDINEVANMETYWEKDDKRVSTNDSRIIQDIKNSTYRLTIWGANVRDSGVYTCIVTNGFDEDRASAVLTVKDRPCPPSLVELNRCLDFSADITWTKCIEYNIPVNNFIIQYNSSFNPGQWVSAKTVNNTQNTTTISLTPWNNYTFRVVATNELGESPSFHTTAVCSTPAAEPDRNPQNVRSIGDTRNMLKIQWTPMNEWEHNGPGFKYQLTVKEHGSTMPYTYIIDNWETDTMEIPVNRPYRPYLVKLQAKNSLGTAKEDPTEYTLYSFEGVPNAWPVEVNVTDVGNTFATVTWTWNSFWQEEQGEMTQILGQLKGFRIQYWRTNEKLSTFREVDVPVTEVMSRQVQPPGTLISSTYLLKNLSQYSNMQIQVRVFNNFHVGPPSGTIDFYTFGGVNRPPKIYKQSAHYDIYYKAGETAEIMCAADGIPKPKYLWKRNGQPYNPNGHGDRIVQLKGEGTLVFYNPEGRDEGIYQCFADNGLGISASIKINFKMAKLESFAEETGMTQQVHEGNHLTLPCIPPQSYPPGKVHWVWKKPDMEWQPIYLSNRVSMDLEGRLRFANVIKADEQGGNAYHCMVINNMLRNTRVGQAHFVEVLEPKEQRHPHHVLWTSPSHMLFVKGSTLILKCIFAGIPTPDVYWKRLQGTLPEKAVFKSFGQELHIENIQESDAGQYQCESRNTGETTPSAYKSFDIIIESAPYWVEEPVDVEAGVNEEATFVCKADGIPKPDYTWYINGVPLEEPNKSGFQDPRISNKRFFKKDENSLNLTKLTLEDHMNIQCNASNKHGYVFADVYLNVLPQIPTIMKHPPAGINATVGRPVTISCLVTCKPYPTVTWYRDESLITGERFHILQHGNLQIQDVMLADAGDYHCIARNINGEVTSSTCKLHVRRKIRITQYPLDLEVTAGDNAVFTCSGSIDNGEEGNIKVYWEKDGQRLWTKEQRLTQNLWNNLLTISETRGRDSGVYTCIITDGFDEERASASLTVKDRPDPPLVVKIERCVDNTADLKWINGNENYVTVQNFIVQYNTSFNPDQWISAKTVNYTQTTATIPLSPWANYTFRVIATNEIGASSPSFHSNTVCRTHPAPPDRNPNNVRSVGNSKNKLKIQWTPMNELEHNGPGFKYQLMLKEHGRPFWYSYIIDNWRNDTFEIPSYKPYTPFQVKLMSVNALGDAMEYPTEYTLYSFEDNPKVRPMDVKVTDAGKTFATVSWKWDSLWLEEQGEMTQIQGQLKGFKIEYWRTNEKGSTFREVVVLLEEVMPTDPPLGNAMISSSYLLRNVSHSSNMEVQIRVFNNYYSGPPTDPEGFATLEGGNRPPKINIQPSVKDIYYRVGESVQIICEANGIPKPRYQWERNGRIYDPNYHGDRVEQVAGKGTIVFKRAEYRDEGVYQCFAINGFGISASIKINLRMAKIGRFAHESGVTHRAHVGEDLTLPCDPPLSDPPAKVQWVRRSYDDWSPIHLDERVTIDSEGRLRFTNVRKSDELYGQAYHCSLMSTYLAIYIIGPEHFVEVIGSTEHTYEPHELWTSPSDQIILKGETLKLKCIFAGNPTPDVNWERVDGILSDRATVYSFGQELSITNVQESDAGKYECTGQNTESTQKATKTFHVTVESAPVWVQEPVDVEARINGDATFVCKADGDPKPDYTWYINDVPLEDAQKQIMKDENTVTLTNLRVEDNMNIQCNASNTHGYVFSDVYLNVFDSDWN